MWVAPVRGGMRWLAELRSGRVSGRGAAEADRRAAGALSADYGRRDAER